MTSCSPASVRSDGTSTCRRVGGTIRAHDTVSRYIDSTTGTPHHRRSNTGDIIPRSLRVAHPSASIKLAPVACNYGSVIHPRRRYDPNSAVAGGSPALADQDWWRVSGACDGW